MKKILLLSLAVMFLCWSFAAAVTPTPTTSNNAPTGSTVEKAPKQVKAISKEEIIARQNQAQTPSAVTKNPAAAEAPADNSAANPNPSTWAQPVINKPAPVMDNNLTSNREINPNQENHELIKESGGVAPPPNPRVILQGGDNMGDATPVGDLPYTDVGTTVGYTHDITLTCPFSNSAPDVFYVYTPTADGSIDVTLCGSLFDTALGILDSGGNEIGCNDDFCGLQSGITGFTVTSGATYYFVVSGYSAASGDYTINVSETPAPTPGDNCADPMIVTLPADLPYTSTSYTCGRGNNYDNTCLGYYDGGEDMIYELDVTSDVTINVLLDPQGTSYTGFSIDYSCPADPTTCIATATNSGTAPYSLVSPVTLTAGTYYIMVDTWPSPNCIPSFDLTIVEAQECVVTCPGGSTPEGEPDCYDEYVDATNGGCNSTPNVFGSISDGETICGTSGTFLFSGSNYRDTDWYILSVANRSTLTATAVGQFPIQLLLLGGTCSSTIQLAVATALPCSTATATTVVNPGDYMVWVGPSVYSGVACGSPYYVTVALSEPPPPPTPDYSVTAPGTWDDPAQNTCGASDDCNLRAGADHIWEIVIPNDGTWQFSLCNTAVVWDSYVYLSLYACDNMWYNDDGCGNLLSNVTANLAAGTYYLTIEGYSSTACGEYILDVQEIQTPDNDNCSDVDATQYPLTDGVPLIFEGDNTNATSDCSQLGWPEVWIPFEITENCMNVKIEACGSSFYMGTLGIWLFTPDCCGVDHLVANSYNWTDCFDGNWTAYFNSLPTGTYYYPLYSSGAQGPYTITVTGTTCPPPPPNDNCADVNPADYILADNVPITYQGDNSGATNSCDSLTWAQVWIPFEIDESCMNVTINSCGTVPALPTVGTWLFSACPCGNHYVAASYEFTTCGDGNWTASWYNLPAGQYWYPLYSAGVTGPYTVTVTGLICPPQPENDDCANATPIGDVTDLPFQTLAATFDGIGACQTAPNIWYIYTASCDGIGIFDLCNSAYDTKMAVFDGATCPEEPPPPPDPVPLQGGEDVASATVISDPLPVVYTGTTAGYIDNYTPSCVNSYAADVVYSYSPPSDQSVDVTLCGSLYDTGITIYEDTEGNEVACNDDYCGLQSGVQSVPMLAGHTYYIVIDGYAANSGIYTLTMIAATYNLLACNDDACNLQSKIAIPVSAGHQYLIEVGGFGSSTGYGHLTTACVPPPPNDNCEDVNPADHILSDGVPEVYTGSNLGATSDCGLLGWAEVWIPFHIDECMNVTINSCGSDPVMGTLGTWLFDSCPCGNYYSTGIYDWTTCGDGNWTASWSNLPAGDYYYPVYSAGSQGSYNITVTGVACPPPPPNFCEQGELVYSNGGVGLVPGTYASQCDPVYPFAAGLADDIVLGADATIGRVVAYIGFWNHTPVSTPANLTGMMITFYNDASGIPGGNPIDGDPNCDHTGDIVASEFVTPDNYVYNEFLPGVWQVECTITPVDLVAGTTYWLEIAPVLPDFTNFGQSGLINTDGITGSNALLYFPLAGQPSWGNPWVPAIDGAFCLKAPAAPAPALSYSPSSFTMTIQTPLADTADLYIGNTGGADLTYTLGVDHSAWMFMAPENGTVPAGATDTVQFICDAGPLSPGTYTGTITINSNDPANPSVGVPVNLTVTPGGGGGCTYQVGDANNSGTFNGLDVTYSVAYFKGGPPPPYSCECTPGNTWFVAGDVNQSCNFNGLDVTYMVSYFKGGPPPHPCADCPPSRMGILIVPKAPANNQSQVGAGQ